jgi:hypothetical protein
MQFRWRLRVNEEHVEQQRIEQEAAAERARQEREQRRIAKLQELNDLRIVNLLKCVNRSGTARFKREKLPRSDCKANWKCSPLDSQTTAPGKGEVTNHWLTGPFLARSTRLSSELEVFTEEISHDVESLPGFRQVDIAEKIVTQSVPDM